MTGLACVLVALALLASAGPRGRRPAVVAAPAPTDGSVRASDAGRWRSWLRRTRRTRARDRDLTALLAGVATQLRAGAPPTEAWTHVLGVPVPDGVPTVADLLGSDAGRAPTSVRARATAAVAATRLAAELGAPLADQLDRVGDALAVEAELEGDRRAALAGPRATATVLSWLPVLGLVLGTGMGADPLGVLLGGGVGSLAGVLGAGALLAGRWWTRVLLSRAARAGASGTS